MCLVLAFRLAPFMPYRDVPRVSLKKKKKKRLNLRDFFGGKSREKNHFVVFNGTFTLCITQTCVKTIINDVERDCNVTFLYELHKMLAA